MDKFCFCPRVRFFFSALHIIFSHLFSHLIGRLVYQPFIHSSVLSFSRSLDRSKSVVPFLLNRQLEELGTCNQSVSQSVNQPLDHSFIQSVSHLMSTCPCTIFLLSAILWTLKLAPYTVNRPT